MYADKKARAFRKLNKKKRPLVRKRSEGRLKEYPSCTDIRAWSASDQERAEYLKELVAQGTDHLGKYVPVPIIFDILIGINITDLEALKQGAGEEETAGTAPKEKAKPEVEARKSEASKKEAKPAKSSAMTKSEAGDAEKPSVSAKPSEKEEEQEEEVVEETDLESAAPGPTERDVEDDELSAPEKSEKEDEAKSAASAEGKPKSVKSAGEEEAKSAKSAAEKSIKSAKSEAEGGTAKSEHGEAGEDEDEATTKAAMGEDAAKSELGAVDTAKSVQFAAEEEAGTPADAGAKSEEIAATSAKVGDGEVQEEGDGVTELGGEEEAVRGGDDAKSTKSGISGKSAIQEDEAAAKSSAEEEQVAEDEVVEETAVGAVPSSDEGRQRVGSGSIPVTEYELEEDTKPPPLDECCQLYAEENPRQLSQPCVESIDLGEPPPADQDGLTTTGSADHPLYHESPVTVLPALEDVPSVGAQSAVAEPKEGEPSAVTYASIAGKLPGDKEPSAGATSVAGKPSGATQPTMDTPSTATKPPAKTTGEEQRIAQQVSSQRVEQEVAAIPLDVAPPLGKRSEAQRAVDSTIAKVSPEELKKMTPAQLMDLLAKKDQKIAYLQQLLKQKIDEMIEKDGLLMEAVHRLEEINVAVNDNNELQDRLAASEDRIKNLMFEKAKLTLEKADLESQYAHETASLKKMLKDGANERERSRSGEKDDSHETELEFLRAKVADLQERLKELDDIAEERDFLKKKLEAQSRQPPPVIPPEALTEIFEEREWLRKRLDSYATLDEKLMELKRDADMKPVLLQEIEALRMRIAELEALLGGGEGEDPRLLAYERDNLRTKLEMMEKEYVAMQRRLQSLGDVEAERDLLKMSLQDVVGAEDEARFQAGECDKLRQERDRLKAKVAELCQMQAAYMDLAERAKAVEAIAAERDLYKAKYEQMAILEMEVGQLRQQTGRSRDLELERDRMLQQLRELESVVADQEDEIQKLLEQIEIITDTPSASSTHLLKKYDCQCMYST